MPFMSPWNTIASTIDTSTMGAVGIESPEAWYVSLCSHQRHRYPSRCPCPTPPMSAFGRGTPRHQRHQMPLAGTIAERTRAGHATSSSPSLSAPGRGTQRHQRHRYPSRCHWPTPSLSAPGRGTQRHQRHRCPSRCPWPTARLSAPRRGHTTPSAPSLSIEMPLTDPIVQRARAGRTTPSAP